MSRMRQDSTQITATVITISASASASEGGNSKSASVGASFSENLVGYKLDGSRTRRRSEPIWTTPACRPAAL